MDTANTFIHKVWPKINVGGHVWPQYHAASHPALSLSSNLYNLTLFDLTFPNQPLLDPLNPPSQPKKTNIENEVMIMYLILLYILSLSMILLNTF